MRQLERDRLLIFRLRYHFFSIGIENNSNMKPDDNQ
jgi:hypothetical protein